MRDERAGLRRAVRTITARLAVPCRQRRGRVRGYPTAAERFEKQRRLQVLHARLAEVEDRIATGTPTVVVGGKRLARLRHNLDEAGLSQAEWRGRWDAARLFLTADGESGAPHGNYTITVTPDGVVTVVLPEPLRHWANVPRGRYRLSCQVSFHQRREEWLDRVTASRAVRYDVTFDPVRGRWYLDASRSVDKAALPTPAELTEQDARLFAVDLNADHLAACVVDPHGNPVGQPRSIPLALTGPTSQRDGRRRTAITALIGLARDHGCAGIAVENLDFADARAADRDTMGRGRRGKKFRRTVAGIPTARFRERLRGMAYHAGLVVVAVDPAYTSRWGTQHWHQPLQDQTTTTTVTGHHAAAVAIGRRAHGHRLRRRPGVTRTRPEDRLGRATGQATPSPRARGANGPPRTTGDPPGRNTRARRRGHPTAPDSQHRSRGHRTPAGSS
jgi:hypothetical protein